MENPRVAEISQTWPATGDRGSIKFRMDGKKGAGDRVKNFKLRFGFEETRNGERKDETKFAFGGMEMALRGHE